MTGNFSATATEEERIRKSIEFQILTMLNHAQRQGSGGYFDCGDWGILEVLWDSGWRTRWLHVEKFEPLIGGV